MERNKLFFDANFKEKEQLPRKFTVSFDAIEIGPKTMVRVSIDGIQVGDTIDDNSKEADFYRFHDVFHYTFAAMLGWSPCMRAMTKRKRKSSPIIDEVEDGARATITEEAISLMIFNNAKRRNFFEEYNKISPALLNHIKEMTAPFEVAVKSKKEWQNTILIGYSLFRELVKNGGGKIHFNMIEKAAIFEA